MAWVPTRLSARGFLDASLQRGGFTCFRTRLSSALKSGGREFDTYPTHWHWQYRILIPGARERSSYKRHKNPYMHTYMYCRVKISFRLKRWKDFSDITSKFLKWWIIWTSYLVDFSYLSWQPDHGPKMKLIYIANNVCQLCLQHVLKNMYFIVSYWGYCWSKYVVFGLEKTGNFQNACSSNLPTFFVMKWLLRALRTFCFLLAQPGRAMSFLENNSRKCLSTESMSGNIYRKVISSDYDYCLIKISSVIASSRIRIW